MRNDLIELLALLVSVGYANAPHSIYVTLYEIDDNGKKKEIERTRYLHGECVYKTIRGKCVISSVDKEKRA